MMLCDKLENEVHLRTGQKLRILRDKKDSGWGESWHHFMAESVKNVSYLIPIVTAAYFNSEPCRKEFINFKEREKMLGRNDLVLPIYYIDVDLHSTTSQTEAWVNDIFARKFFDWRPYRHEDEKGSKYNIAIEELAASFRKVLDRASKAEDSGVRNNGVSEQRNSPKRSKKIVTPRLEKLLDVPPSSREEIKRKYDRLTKTQQILVKYVHRDLLRTEITVDELFVDLKTKHKADAPKSRTELYYRLRVLEYQGFVDLSHAGVKTTTVSPVELVQAVGVENELWNT